MSGILIFFFLSKTFCFFQHFSQLVRFARLCLFFLLHDFSLLSYNICLFLSVSFLTLSLSHFLSLSHHIEMSVLSGVCQLDSQFSVQFKPKGRCEFLKCRSSQMSFQSCLTLSISQFLSFSILLFYFSFSFLLFVTLPLSLPPSLILLESLISPSQQIFFFSFFFISILSPSLSIFPQHLFFTPPFNSCLFPFFSFSYRIVTHRKTHEKATNSSQRT